MTPNYTTVPDDVLVIGAGVIGLSLAYELAGRGLTVRLLDRGSPGGEASWAGAGILPSAPSRPRTPAEHLLALANQVHEVWSGQLRDEVGIDNGYRRSGGVYLAESAEVDLIAPLLAWAEEVGIDCRRLSSAELAELEPTLAGGLIARPGFAGGALVPGEAQIRNPWHLRALEAAAVARGVRIEPGLEVRGFVTDGGRVRGVETDLGPLSAGSVCLTSGAWTAGLLGHLGWHVPLRPIRGQIVLLSGERPLLARIVNVGRRYLVPREDGRVLIGSTEEDVGFDRQNTAEGVRGLLEFGLATAPGLSGLRVERSWAGLRPSTADDLPYLGRIPNWENAYLAAGHFRAGLQLSAATAVLLADEITGQPPTIALDSLRIDRVAQGGGNVPRSIARPSG